MPDTCPLASGPTRDLGNNGGPYGAGASRTNHGRAPELLTRQKASLKLHMGEREVEVNRSAHSRWHRVQNVAKGGASTYRGRP